MCSHRYWSKSLFMRIAAISFLTLAITPKPVQSQSIAVQNGVRAVIMDSRSSSDYSNVTINNSGSTLFASGILTAPIYKGTSNGGLITVMNTGGPAPGFPGSIVGSFSLNAPQFSDSDVSIVFGNAYDGTVTRLGIWTQRGTESPQLLAGTDMDAPGTGTKFRYFSDLQAINKQGQIALWANLQNPSDPQDPLYEGQGIWVQKSIGGPLQSLVVSGQSAPGMPGFQYKSVSTPTINNSGDIAFRGTAISSTNSQVALWVAEGGSGVALRVATRTQVEGLATGIQLSSIYSNNINDAGKVSFFGNLTGPGITNANNFAILAETDHGFRIALQEGQALPGLPSGQFVSDQFSANMNNVGEITGLAFITGNGVNTTDRRALITETGEMGLRIVARDGNQVPDLPIGVLFKDIGANGGIQINIHNTIVFGANLTGPGTISGTDSGFFAEVSPGVLKTIVRNGDTIEVAPSVFKTINGFNPDSSLNDNGQFAFVAYFTDNTEGVFVITVPEAGTTTLLSMSALAFIGCTVAKRIKRRTA